MMTTVSAVDRLLRRVSDWRRWQRKRRAFCLRYALEITEHRPVTDVFVVSYPKSGRTWHRMLLGGYVAAQSGREASAAADVEGLTAGRTGNRIRYTHNGANFVDGLGPDHQLVATPDLWVGRKVIFIVREPKDVLVSAWFHATQRYRIFDGDIASFIRDPRFGAAKLSRAMNRWWCSRDCALSYMVTSYEALSLEPGAVLRQTLRFLGGWEVDESLIARCVAASTFDNMRQLESAGAVSHASMRSQWSNSAARKVREGRVGGYTQYLSPEDISYVDEHILRSPYHRFSEESEHGRRSSDVPLEGGIVK